MLKIGKLRFTTIGRFRDICRSFHKEGFTMGVVVGYNLAKGQPVIVEGENIKEEVRKIIEEEHKN